MIDYESKATPEELAELNALLDQISWGDGCRPTVNEFCNVVHDVIIAKERIDGNTLARG